MPSFAELEITLRRRDADSFAVEFRFNAPDADAEVRLLDDGAGAVKLDLAALRALELDSKAYGEALTKAIFHDPAIAQAFAQAVAATQSQSSTLRLRLFIEPSAADLHSLHWETLRDPSADAPLFAGEQVVFSRYLSSQDWRPVGLRPQGSMRALAVVSSPSNLDQYPALAPVDVEGELARATAALPGIAITPLASRGSATLNNIAAQLRDGFDVLYLVCHGALIDQDPKLWLESETGAVAVVAGSELVQRIKELNQRPRLIVLASCQSAGGSSRDAGSLAALGPRLAEAGIPAVVAMQGNVSMETVARFMPIFFKELLRDGQIDRAMAVARGAVRDRPDYWVPVLFMRLRSGRIWYVPGFGDDPGRFAKWPSIQNSIQQGRCTPILGAGVTEGLFGPIREIAVRWSEQYHYPMAPHNREDLASVAQFLAVNQDPLFPRDELLKYLGQELVRRHPADLPAELHDAPLDQKLATISAKVRERDPYEPHRVLADKPFPLYITTNADDLLEDALRDAGRNPRSEFCRWNSYLETLPYTYDENKDPRPDAKNPLVYHLYGRLSELDSLVLTEDDYFDYLIGVKSSKDLIPGGVRRALADTALLFLGFRLEEWNFRVLFRSIMSQEGGKGRIRPDHVAAQIDPEEGRILEPERARKYLESYFQGSRISIYWGNVDDFMRALLRKP